MKKKNGYVLSIDQGTTGSRAFIFDSKGSPIASSYKEFKQFYPKPGWVEHDPMEIWGSVKQTIDGAISKSGINPAAIVAIGITNQRETTVVWDKKTGKPIYHAIVWQCRRTAKQCEQIKKHQALIRRATGLVVDAYFSATKIAWLLDQVKGARSLAKQGRLAFGTIDSWLIWQLTAGQSHVTDMTNASRTMIFDINKRAWSEPLLKLFNIPKNILPTVNHSGSIFGKTAKIGKLPSGIPISAVMGDQQAALYGQGCFTKGSMKNTYGTGCFLLLNTGLRRIISTKGLLTTIAANSMGKPVYALEGAVFIAGALVQWLRDELKVIPTAIATQEMIKGLKDTNGVYVVPAFVGLGAPYWNPNARGIISGLTRGANVNHIVRACLEAIAYQTKDIVNLMQQESRLTVKSLAVDGGACRNDFLMQFQADMLQAKLFRPVNVDTTAAGVAYLAGVTSGIYKLSQLKTMRRVDAVFNARMPKSLVNEKYKGWQHAVQQALV